MLHWMTVTDPGCQLLSCVAHWLVVLTCAAAQLQLQPRPQQAAQLEAVDAKVVLHLVGYALQTHDTALNTCGQSNVLQQPGKFLSIDIGPCESFEPQRRPQL